MKVALVVLPSWARFAPPLGPALLKPYLEKQGHEVFGFDVSNMMYHRAPEALKPYWGPEHSGHVWVRESFVRDFVRDNDALLREMEDAVLASGADVVGFSLFFTTELMSVEFARRLKQRKPSLFIVFGGPQGTHKNRQLFQYPSVDAVVPGEGERPMSALLEALAQGRRGAGVPGVYVRTPDGYIFSDENPIQDLDEFPFADFSDFPPSAYVNRYALPSYFSRGCFKKCVFCDVGRFWKNWRVRSGARVFAEVKHQLEKHPDVRAFEFHDPIINSDLKALEEFCDAVLREKEAGNPLFKDLQWNGNAIVRYDLKRPLLEKMARAGCDYLQLGIESGSQAVLNSMKKGYTVPNGERMLADMAAVGIESHINLMIGFPTETEENFRETLDFVRRNAANIVKIHASESFTSIDPGTYLYDHAQDLYGVAADRPDGSGHQTYWTSMEGRNDYGVRLRRYFELCELAKSLDIDLGQQYDRILNYKDQLLADFQSYRRAASAAAGRAS